MANDPRCKIMLTFVGNTSGKRGGSHENAPLSKTERDTIKDSLIPGLPNLRKAYAHKAETQTVSKSTKTRISTPIKDDIRNGQGPQFAE